MSWLIDPTQRVLSSALDGLALREQAVAANMANVDTPGYRAESVDFESTLQAAIADAQGTPGGMTAPTATASAAAGPQRTSGLHLGGAGFAITTASAADALTAQPQGIQTRVDGNGVDVESDMTALAETQLKYAAVSRMLSGKLDLLKTAVGGR